MTAKSYLINIRNTSKKIVLLTYELENIQEKKYSLKAVKLSEKVQNLQTYQNNIDYLLMQEQEILKEKSKLYSDWWECRKLIKSISNQDYSDVLRYYYLLNFKTWNRVAQKMHICEREVYKIHKNALKEFQEILKEFSKVHSNSV